MQVSILLAIAALHADVVALSPTLKPRWMTVGNAVGLCALTVMPWCQPYAVVADARLNAATAAGTRVNSGKRSS
jgi:hypothetical protein